jgi:two-component system CheB/CheR fusion protein
MEGVVILEAIITAEGNVEDVRVLTDVAACATGEEVYSIVICLLERAGEGQGNPSFQVFATDLNEELLKKARTGLYTKSMVQDVSPQRLQRFFVEQDGGYRINKPLREAVVFARQNILNDPAFSRIDLISCRNVLIYIDSASQKRIMRTFHYALRPTGFLMLGTSETVAFPELFTEIDRAEVTLLGSCLSEFRLVAQVRATCQCIHGKA